MPLKIPAMKIGRWQHPTYGVIDITQQKLDEVKRNFLEGTIGRRAFIRIAHDKDNAPTFGGAPAEAWIDELVQEGDILFALAEPTDGKVVEMIKTQKYRYASPEYQDNYKSKIDGSSKGAVLEAIALTNEPFLTGLPENIMLSDPPDTVYLNFKEVSTNMEKVDQLLEQQTQTNGLLKKLSDGIHAFTSLFGGGQKPEPTPAAPTPTPAPQPAPAAPTLNLAGQDDFQKKLADMQAKIDEANANALQAQSGQRVAEINKKLSEYVAAGIPPAYIDNARKILLGEDGKESGVIKLADNDFTARTAEVYGMLDAFPESARVKLSQVGAAGQPPAEEQQRAEESKRLCDQVMSDLGAKKVDGKYVL
ncbi:phage protease [Tumebacillus flagellatus]|uniref:Uncharacterized protein n=1 Tax=Tumebacillus flagellatus TaxID=1157490 RepID=A0A074LMD3_9BACL|nr:phage protease [Tumebacillus flagellatus]KEO81043.1 hypothetical protein EL26_22960 [Tumebacillus flagellatus]